MILSVEHIYSMNTNYVQVVKSDLYCMIHIKTDVHVQYTNNIHCIQFTYMKYACMHVPVKGPGFVFQHLQLILKVS